MCVRSYNKTNWTKWVDLEWEGELLIRCRHRHRRRHCRRCVCGFDSGTGRRFYCWYFSENRSMWFMFISQIAIICCSFFSATIYFEMRWRSWTHTQSMRWTIFIYFISENKEQENERKTHEYACTSTSRKQQEKTRPLRSQRLAHLFYVSRNSINIEIVETITSGRTLIWSARYSVCFAAFFLRPSLVM